MYQDDDNFNKNPHINFALGQKINSLQMVYHDIIKNDYNKTHKFNHEKCTLIKQNSLLALKCAEVAYAKAQERLCMQLKTPSNFGEILQYQGHHSILWDEKNLDRIDSDFKARAKFIDNSFQSFESDMKDIINEDLKNIKRYHIQYYQMINFDMGN